MPADTYRSVQVQHVRTREARMFLGLTPREAVMAAHAGRLGIQDSHDLEETYGHLVTQRHGTINCGDWQVCRA